MENPAPPPPSTTQFASNIPQQSNSPTQNNVPAELSPQKKLVELAIGLIGTILTYWLASFLWRKIAYAVFAPSLAQSGEDFPGIIFFAYIAIIPVFAILAIILWRHRRNLALGILVGTILATLYFIVSCSMTLAPSGCLELLS